MVITSSKNSLLQEIRRAAAGGRPTYQGLIVAEGPHLLEEALHGSWTVEQVLVVDEVRARLTPLLNKLQAEIVEVSEKAFAATSTTEAHQGVITLLRPRIWSWSDFHRSPQLMVVLDRIQDPGNAGTIIRSAEAFAATGVVFLRGSVHVANGKLLRAAAGSVFRVPLLEDVTPADLLNETRRREIRLFALTPSGGKPLLEVNLSQPVALVLGSEGAGISPLLQQPATAVRIPVQNVESLNVGIAASITLFEAARQRNETL